MKGPLFAEGAWKNENIEGNLKKDICKFKMAPVFLSDDLVSLSTQCLKQGKVNRNFKGKCQNHIAIA